MKAPLYLTTQVLPGNKVEVQVPNLPVGQTVQVVILASETTHSESSAEPLSLEQRLAFLKLPLAERRQILSYQADSLVSHYQENPEWQELMNGDIIDY